MSDLDIWIYVVFPLSMINAGLFSVMLITTVGHILTLPAEWIATIFQAWADMISSTWYGPILGSVTMVAIVMVWRWTVWIIECPGDGM